MWLDLLKTACDQTSKAAVAAELSRMGKKPIGRTAISLIYSGKYPASTERIETLVLMRYANVQCPHLEKEITFHECREHHTKDAPTSSPYAMRHWRACLNCPNRRNK